MPRAQKKNARSQAKPKASKKCKGKACKGKRHPIENFPGSPHSADGKLGYCRSCWSDVMKEARAKGLAKRRKNGEAPRKPGRPKGSKNGASKNGLNGANGHALVNKALDLINSNVRIRVEADDGETKEFRNEKKALKQAMMWKLDGYGVRIFRECDFVLDARIVG
jgi:hypothetical protein